MKSTVVVTQDTLTDCLTIHPLQQSLSPLARIDSSLNSSPGVSHESYSGMFKLRLFALKCLTLRLDYFNKSLPPCNYVHIIGLSFRYRLCWTALKCLSSLFHRCSTGTRVLQQSPPGPVVLLTRWLQVMRMFVLLWVGPSPYIILLILSVDCGLS